ncbi:hypothetical protein [Mycobacteroides abscessus]|uniref:hypothetical protein n=1 Tax=Mycobacteroides abscessus TaxID=36809 RepID=UPI00092C86AB|nr:hypothetical protein [Mycobacteroides abscessus]SIK94068.1 Uncharacterised protein [Mycobacteroides abscessus subsp. abscessus]SIN01749.1 Uncharacterised protein [Mycobacteroides abscessus subsp. abscessus]SIN10621.1 Uncharacterised protein [Mycobacteroides abscessus subsp. abscessus]
MGKEELPRWLYDNPVLNIAIGLMGAQPTIIDVLGVLLSGAILGISAVAATNTHAPRSGVPVLILGAMSAVAVVLLPSIFAMAQQMSISITAGAPEAAPAAHSLLPGVGRDVTVPVAWLLLAGLAMWLLALQGQVWYCAALLADRESHRR